MKLVIGCDHAAFEAKEKLKNILKQEFEVDDVGTHSSERANYPDYATELCKKVLKEGKKGILLCGSGIGMSMAANRYKGVRAALCRTEEDAKLSREHNDSNVLCLGARINSLEELEKIVRTWLSTDFEGGRHTDRISLFDQLGEGLH